MRLFFLNGCQARLHQGNQSCLAAGPLRRRHLPAGGSQAQTGGCRPRTASTTREKGQSSRSGTVWFIFKLILFMWHIRDTGQVMEERAPQRYAKQQNSASPKKYSGHWDVIVVLWTGRWKITSCLAHLSVLSHPSTSLYCCAGKPADTLPVQPSLTLTWGQKCQFWPFKALYQLKLMKLISSYYSVFLEDDVWDPVLLIHECKHATKEFYTRALIPDLSRSCFVCKQIGRSARVSRLSVRREELLFLWQEPHLHLGRLLLDSSGLQRHRKRHFRFPQDGCDGNR